MRVICAIVLIVGLAIPAHAQEERGWSFSGYFNGSSNSDGLITKAEPALGYKFNRYFSTYAGLPFYFVNIDPNATVTPGGAMKGLGNAFLGFRGRIDGEIVNYTSNLEFTAPTGDKDRGFSTGRVTVDWTHRFSRPISSFTPFGSVGIANTVSDTAFFIRPFSSYGLVGHFEGGTTYDVSPALRLGASGYAVRGSGEQRIISKVIERSSGSPGSSGQSRGRGSGNSSRVFETQTETISQAELVNDRGFATWIGLSPWRELDFHVGYSRSVSYDFNTLFFGVGFRVGK